MDSNLLSLLKIPSVPEDIHYWIIRTNGGEYYEAQLSYRRITR